MVSAPKCIDLVKQAARLCPSEGGMCLNVRGCIKYDDFTPAIDRFTTQMCRDGQTSIQSPPVPQECVLCRLGIVYYDDIILAFDGMSPEMDDCQTTIQVPEKVECVSKSSRGFYTIFQPFKILYLPRKVWSWSIDDPEKSCTKRECANVTGC